MSLLFRASSCYHAPERARRAANRRRAGRIHSLYARCPCRNGPDPWLARLATPRASSATSLPPGHPNPPLPLPRKRSDYAELTDPSPPPSLIGRIQRAYGPNGLGILAVSNVPDYEERRKALLPLARRLASLPEDELTKLEDPASFYSVGWSHGKEVFQGKPDLAKGSFYANPLHNEVDLSALGEEEAARLRKECERTRWRRPPRCCARLLSRRTPCASHLRCVPFQ